MTLFADSDFMNLDVNCPVSNMQVSLYRVADEDYNLVDAFSHYSIDLKQDVQGAAMPMRIAALSLSSRKRLLI